MCYQYLIYIYILTLVSYTKMQKEVLWKHDSFCSAGVYSRKDIRFYRVSFASPFQEVEMPC